MNLLPRSFPRIVVVFATVGSFAFAQAPPPIVWSETHPELAVSAAAAGGFRGGDVSTHIMQASDGQLLRSLVTRNTYGVRQLAFSPDGQWLAVGCSELTNFDGQVEVWRVTDWVRVHEFPVHSPALAFSSDGKVLVTLRRQALELWRMTDGRLLHSHGPPPHGNYSLHLSIAISPGSDRIVTGNVRHLLGGVPEGSVVAIRFPILLDAIVQAEDLLTLGWTGGYDEYQVQLRTFDSPNWTNTGLPTSDRTLALPLDQPGGMLRVIGNAP